MGNLTSVGWLIMLFITIVFISVAAVVIAELRLPVQVVKPTIEYDTSYFMPLQIAPLQENTGSGSNDTLPTVIVSDSTKIVGYYYGQKDSLVIVDSLRFEKAMNKLKVDRDIENGIIRTM